MVCNTIPSLRIDFQAISIRIEQGGVLSEDHSEFNARVPFMEKCNSIYCIGEISLRFPSTIFLSVAFPMNKVLSVSALPSDINHIIHFIFLVSILSDIHRTRANSDLSFKRFLIGADSRYINDWVNAHRARQVQLDCVGSY